MIAMLRRVRLVGVDRCLLTERGATIEGRRRCMLAHRREYCPVCVAGEERVHWCGAKLAWPTRFEHTVTADVHAFIFGGEER